MCIAECSNRVKVVKHSYLLPLLVHFKVYSVLLVAFFGSFINNSLHIHVLLIKTLHRNQSHNSLSTHLIRYSEPIKSILVACLTHPAWLGS